MFGKIFASIYDSSIAEAWKVRVVFQDMIVLAEPNGVLDMTPQAISRRTNIPLRMILAAIPVLEAEDSLSRSKEQDGRRIVRLDPNRSWGWRIVNYVRYRESASREMLRMAEADRKRAYRAKFNRNPPPTPPTCTPKIKNKSKNKNSPVTCPDMSRTYTSESRILLHFLNELTGAHYREVATNLGLIEARLSEPEITLEGCKQMLTRQARLWKGGDYERFLRPETLFGKTKFEGYYAAKDLPVNPERRDYGQNNTRSERDNPRNAGTCKHPLNDYAAAAERKSKLQRQMVMSEHPVPPATQGV